MRRISASMMAAALAISVASAASAATTTVALQTPGPLNFTDSTGAFFSMVATQPASAGNYDSFMRLEHCDNEQGYNSSSTSTMDLVPLDSGHSSQLVMNQVLGADGMVHLAMNYDEPINQGNLLTLQELTLVVSSDPNKAGPSGPGPHAPWVVQSMPMSAGDQVVYQMSAANDGTGNPFVIQLDADHAFANTSADLYVDLDLSHVAGLASLDDANHYLYVYSRFSGADGSYEEWFALQPDTCIPTGGGPGTPEPASLGVLALGGLGLLARRRRASRN